MLFKFMFLVEIIVNYGNLRVDKEYVSQKDGGKSV